MLDMLLVKGNFDVLSSSRPDTPPPGLLAHMEKESLLADTPLLHVRGGKCAKDDAGFDQHPRAQEQESILVVQWGGDEPGTQWV